MIEANTAFTPPPFAAISGPIATRAFLAALADISDLQTRHIECIRCRYRLGKWDLSPTIGIALPVHRPPPGVDLTPGIVPYTDRLAAGKGPIVDSFTHDARGTITYGCPKCSKRTALRAERRTRLFLEAVDRAHRFVAI